MGINSFSPPELNLHASSYNNYWNVPYNQSQCDIVENYDTNTNSAVIQGTAMHTTDVYQDVYSENTVVPREATVYYQQVNYDCSQLRNGLNIGGGSAQEPFQVKCIYIIFKFIYTEKCSLLNLCPKEMF